jgi:predicted ATPase
MLWRSPHGELRLAPRSAELGVVLQRLAEGQRLVTIWGMSGAGKTVLATEVVRNLRADREGEVGWCSLASTREADALRARVARAMSLGSQSAGLDLVRALRARGPYFLVLDGVDGVAEPIRELLDDWLRAAPELRILVTACAPLGLQGEQAVEVGPHPDALELFLGVVALRWPGYAPEPAHREQIARIIAPLEGVPHAIQLAAAISWDRSPEQMLELLEAELGEDPALPHAMRPMARAAAAGWAAIDDVHRDVLAGVTVFHGGFTLQAAERVLGGLRAQCNGGVPETVHGLTQRLLVREVATPPGEPARFSVCDVVRTFAATRLRERGEAAEVAMRHADHYLAFAERLLTGPQEHGLETSLRRLEVERDNLAAILDGVGQPGRRDARWVEAQLRAAWVLDDLSTEMGLSQGEQRSLDAALRCAGDDVDPAAVGRGRLVRAGAMAFSPLAPQAEAECRAAIELAERAGDVTLRARAHTRLGLVLGRLVRAEEALAASREAIRLHKHTGDVRDEVLALEQEGTHLQALNRTDQAVLKFQRALWMCRAHGHARGELRGEAGLGYHFSERDDYRKARSHYERCITLAREVDAHRMAMLATGYLGMLHFEEGRMLDAVECLNAAVAEAREFDDKVAEGVFLAGEAAVRASMDDLDGARSAARELEQAFAAHPIVAPVARIHLAHLELASGQRCLADGDAQAAEALLASAAAVAAQARGQGSLGPNRSKDIRTALRILERALGRNGAPAVGPPSVAPAAGALLSVAADGSWFQLGDGQRVDLSRRNALRIILVVLMERRDSGQDRPVSVHELIAAVWPGEKFAWSSGLNRLHVALATLRALGLRGVLLRRGEGYSIDPTVRVCRSRPSDFPPPSARRKRFS